MSRRRLMSLYQEHTAIMSGAFSPRQVTETLTTYRKTVKLPAGTVEQARPIRVALDEQVHQAIVGLTSHEPSLQVTRSTDEGGNSTIRASADAYDLLITTRSGQDSRFRAGERQTFISYTLSATSSLRSLNRAVSISHEVSFYLRGIGALLFAALFFFGIDLLLRRSGMMFIRIPVQIVVLVVLAGAWLGERLGAVLGDWLESRARSRAESTGSLPRLELLWMHLERRFNTLVTSFELI